MRPTQSSVEASRPAGASGHGSAAALTLDPRTRAIATLLVGTGAVMAQISGTALNVAIPELTVVFDVPPSTIAWVSIAFMLSQAGLLTVFGRLADLRGRRGLYTLGIALFLVSSVLAGFSGSVGWLIAWRALQGVGGALMGANSVAYLVEIYPVNRRGFVVGVWEACIAIGQGIGPLIGGVLLGWFDWRAVFFVNVPFGLLMLALVPRWMVEPPRPRTRHGFDLVGAFLFATAIATLLFAITQGYTLGWTSLPVAGSLVTALVCGVLFVLVEQRVVEPMVDLRMFAIRTFSAGNLAKVSAYLPFSAGAFLLPFYLERALDFPPASIGLSLTPMPVGMLLASLLAGPLSDRIGTRVLAPAGMVLLTLGSFLLTQVSPEQGVGPVLLAMALNGIGVGAFIAPNDSAILSATPPGKLGVANGIMGVARTLGLLLGVSAAGGLLSARLVANGDAFVPSFHEVYVVVTAVAFVGIWLAGVRAPGRQ